MHTEDTDEKSSDPSFSNGMNTEEEHSQLLAAKNEMKILFVVTKGDMGGAQKRIIDLAESYTAAGYDVTVASGLGGYLPARLKDSGITHQRLQYLSRSNPLKIVAYIFELWNYLRKQQEVFDVVHLNSSSALAGALSCKAPLSGKPKAVFTFRGLSILAPGYKTNPLKKLFYKYSYKAFLPFVDVGVFQCEANQSTAHALDIKTNHDVVIKDGIDPATQTYLDPADAREKLEAMVGEDLSSKKLVGAIGRLSYQKHYAFLIRQLRKLKKHRTDVACIIIGDGPEYDHLAGIIHRLGLTDSVFLIGRQDNAAQFLAGFDVFTLVSRYEGLSMTLTEAMHAGVPLLVSDVGCSGSIVADQRMVFHPGSAVEFIDKLDDLLDADDRDELSQAVYTRSKDLVLDKSATKYMDLYSSILGKNATL